MWITLLKRLTTSLLHRPWSAFCALIRCSIKLNTNRIQNGKCGNPPPRQTLVLTVRYTCVRRRSGCPPPNRHATEVTLLAVLSSNWALVGLRSCWSGPDSGGDPHADALIFLRGGTVVVCVCVGEELEKQQVWDHYPDITTWCQFIVLLV